MSAASRQRLLRSLRPRPKGGNAGLRPDAARFIAAVKRDTERVRRVGGIVLAGADTHGEGKYVIDRIHDLRLRSTR